MLWAHDYDDAISAFVIPDDWITETQRAALAATPYCFADPGDCEPAQWWAAVRAMGALGGEGEEADDYFAVRVSEADDYVEKAPPLTQAEIRESFGAWSACRAADLCRSDDLSGA